MRNRPAESITTICRKAFGPIMVFMLLGLAGCSGAVQSAASGGAATDQSGQLSSSSEDWTFPNCDDCPKICKILPGKWRALCLQSCQQRCVTKCAVCHKACLSKPAGAQRDACNAACDKQSF